MAAKHSAYVYSYILCCARGHWQRKSKAQSILLQAETARVIFSWNDVDPTMPDGSDASRHMTRGSASLNLLGGLPDPPPEPSDSETFFVGVDSVSNLHHLVQSVLN